MKQEHCGYATQVFAVSPVIGYRISSSRKRGSPGTKASLLRRRATEGLPFLRRIIARS
jgi:hypothetical protein